MKFINWDTNLYRGSRPHDTSDLSLLWKNGIRTIISLEEGWADILGWKNEPATWRKMGGVWLQVKLSSIIAPTQGQLEAIYALIFAHCQLSGVFVHCYSGVDRTGIVCADWEVYGRKISPEVAWQRCCEQGMHKRFQWLWKRSFFKIEPRKS